jgi:DNA-binding response OmpR family regulator
MKVLFVDDDATIRLTVGAQLRRLGHDVVVAADGREGWRAYELATPDVVITDLVMPGESGASLCRRIRSSQRIRYTFIIVLTSIAGKAEYRAVMEAGADDFLPKPCTEEDLSVRLRVAERVLRLQSRVKTLEGFLPICSYCRLMRNGNNEWRPIGEYVAARASVTVDSALCPECAAAV